ncbi:MAG TPA: hypothetical protein PLG43_07025 [Spirochaetia bacterium]|nr:hypothetical protein [Spirochaetia bacterium]
MKRNYSYIVIGFSILAVVGCATIVKGSDETVSFQSEPEGAAISVYDADGFMVAEGITPITIPLPKGSGYFQAAKYRIVFETPGYAKKEIWIKGSLESGWYIAGNFLIGGILGWLIIDPLSGAMWTLKPATVNARLDKTGAGIAGTSLHIVLASQVSPETLKMAIPVTYN